MAWADTIIAVLTKWRSNARSGPSRESVSYKIKNRFWLIGIFLVAAVLAASLARADAGCDQDCKSEYVSALGECRAQYDHGDHNQQDLEDCLVDTRGEYDDCIDDCTSLGAGGVVACKSSGRAVTPVIFIPSHGIRRPDISRAQMSWPVLWNVPWLTRSVGRIQPAHRLRPAPRRRSRPSAPA
jgi:hypothetical protein